MNDMIRHDIIRNHDIRKYGKNNIISYFKTWHDKTSWHNETCRNHEISYNNIIKHDITSERQQNHYNLYDKFWIQIITERILIYIECLCTLICCCSMSSIEKSYSYLAQFFGTEHRGLIKWQLAHFSDCQARKFWIFYNPTGSESYFNRSGQSGL